MNDKNLLLLTYNVHVWYVVNYQCVDIVILYIIMGKIIDNNKIYIIVVILKT